MSETTRYDGFEQGPIRPPSEAGSLLLRVTRNCPWNKCTFCTLYKKDGFSRRSLEHIKKDIDLVSVYLEKIKQSETSQGKLVKKDLEKILAETRHQEAEAFHAAYSFYMNHMESVFLQDANSLIMKPSELEEILLYVRQKFPGIRRITSYARSNTVARMADDDLQSLADAGLNRIHIGMESGSDKVLAFVKKGVTKEKHIKAGLKVKKAGIQLSEYYIAGLGGQEMWREHAEESADALNQIDPDFIRIRTLTVPGISLLSKDLKEGRFKRSSDHQKAEELHLFFSKLENIHSTVKSDHMLNLLEEVDGTYPDEKERLVGIIQTYLDMDDNNRMYFQVGRRFGQFRNLSDMDHPGRLDRIIDFCNQNGITPDNADSMISEIMKRFI